VSRAGIGPVMATVTLVTKGPNFRACDGQERFDDCSPLKYTKLIKAVYRMGWLCLLLEATSPLFLLSLSSHRVERTHGRQG
jgi:hypothetical protein